MKFINGFPLPEFVDADELAEEQNLSLIALHGAYQDRLHQFRSDVMRLMIKHDALQPDGSWLVFDHTEEKGDGPVLLTPRIDICIATKNVPDLTGKAKHGNQNIRVILNEAYTLDDGIEYFVIDSAVDYDGDSQYNVGVMPADPVTGGEGVTVPIFIVADSKLGLYSPNGYGAFPEIQSVEERIVPFGHFSNIEDKFHALNIAYDLLETVVDREPLHTSQAN